MAGGRSFFNPVTLTDMLHLYPRSEARTNQHNWSLWNLNPCHDIWLQSTQCIWNWTYTKLHEQFLNGFCDTSEFLSHLLPFLSALHMSMCVLLVANDHVQWTCRSEFTLVQLWPKGSAESANRDSSWLFFGQWIDDSLSHFCVLFPYISCDICSRKMRKPEVKWVIETS